MPSSGGVAWGTAHMISDVGELEAAIYEAAVVPEKWAPLLDKITDAIGAKGGVFFGVSTVANSWIASAGLREDMERFVASGWALRNTRMQTGLRRGLHLIPRFVTEDDYYDPGELENEAIYQEFFYPQGLGYSAGTIAVLPHEDMLCVNFERGSDRGPFEDASLARLNELRPHLLRASLVTARLGMAQIHTALATLTAIDLPAAAIAQSGAIIEANSRFSAASEVWTTRGFNRIALLDPAADTMLRETLSRLATAEGQNSIPVRNGPGGSIGAVLQVVPMRGLALDIFGNTAAIVVLSAPNKGEPDGSLLLSLFDLTPSEVEVARSIAVGLTVTQIAAQRKRSVATVRNQLRGVLEKTGASRQADLILMLKGLGL